jgi:hypothetical protein
VQNSRGTVGRQIGESTLEGLYHVGGGMAGGDSATYNGSQADRKANGNSFFLAGQLKRVSDWRWSDF